ncbi:accessory Sec system S-layer assembly protein [Virgibacillus halodenitrificans]|uniref:accessory Sec system S-layer assembly protein n=1 Tax=Virgibacillus halodenitrificans TaxID=1482 RepID=UPI000EF5153A|nr:accessory Sec system S-layer assembly protein [Virgibacillus halodenitrificans]MCG1027062.1 accessory Sec system S-layer assembly protein [Virgibacillus halodenitrificans]
MFNFSKGTKKQKQVAKAEDYLKDDVRISKEETEEIETEISIPEEWNLTDEERYVYAFHNSQSPNLKVNQISIYGMELTDTGEGYKVTGLIRSTVTQPIQFGSTTILLLDESQEPIARKEFDLSILGTLPEKSARPWTFIFDKNDILKEKTQSNSWSLAFEIKKPHQLDLEDSWEKSIADQTRSSLEKLVQNAPDLKPGEVNFMGIEAKKQENGDLAVTILIRNGADKNIQLEQIPLGIKDANETEVARGSFKMENFTVKANTSKPWTFIFPASMVTTEEFDLTKWKAFPLQ